MKGLKEIVSVFVLLAVMVSAQAQEKTSSWIRINQLGYSPKGVKVAVLGSKLSSSGIKDFELVDAKTSKPVLKKSAGKDFGKYGPFLSSYRLDFTEIKTPGTYYLQAGTTRSPVFMISADAYKGAADFALRYMRQQRSGFNPFLKDSCHTHDGYIVYGPVPDKTFIDVSGGWHDATDYLQYSTTSANATYNLLAAYRDFPGVFGDSHQANGLDGKNGTKDILDEAKWGLDWLLKMHPKPDWLFNQLADDRDHVGFRLPNVDSADYGYGKGKGRPVYFITGEPQGLGKYKNNATGAASTAGKFASAFALAAQIYSKNKSLSDNFKSHSISAYKLGLAKPGAAQTASVRSPYIYAEDNWVDDMELGAAALYQLTGDKNYLTQAEKYSEQEHYTPWMGADTAKHYQFYPFHNFGHYELAKKNTPAAEKARLISFYKEGIDKVWQKAKNNAFYRGVPFIWCSNNLTTAFAIQCYQYRKLSGDQTYFELEQACTDWLFGCNPWGTSMVYGLPANGDTPVDPHSSFTVLKKYPLDGALVDGPVYASIFKGLIGLQLHEADEYAEFQSDYIVYHDDYGDYSTNEPTMDGTASLIYLLAAKESDPGEVVLKKKVVTDANGAIIRGDISRKEIALVFTGDEFGDGGAIIRKTLKENNVKASFFLTGNFYTNPKFQTVVKGLKEDGNYMGAHSDKHLLFADWTKRDSTLVTRQQFMTDIENNYKKMAKLGISKKDAQYFLPAYEWYNSEIAGWTKEMNLTLVNFSPGTRSTSDYTYPGMAGYRGSDEIYKSITDLEAKDPNGLNGFILLIHIGTDAQRTDKMYNKLGGLLKELKGKGYSFVRINQLLEEEVKIKK